MAKYYIGFTTPMAKLANNAHLSFINIYYFLFGVGHEEPESRMELGADERGRAPDRRQPLHDPAT